MGFVDKQHVFWDVACRKARPPAVAGVIYDVTSLFQGRRLEMKS